MAKGPKTLEQLSDISESRPDRLGQVLRLLYNNGIFMYDAASGLYYNNEASSLLRSDHWTQWHNWVELYGNQFYDVARGIPESIKKQATRSAAQVNYDTDADMFSYFQQRGWVPLLHRTLSGGAEAMAPGILDDYPWASLLNRSGSAVVADIGGGGGGLIASLLRRFPDLRGAIFDLPDVIAQTETLFRTKDGKYADVGDRVELIGGDFFSSVPPFETYTMKWCLHDWTDDKAAIILSNIRKAIAPGSRSRLIVMETVLADGRAQRLSRYADVHMMMTAGGRERTEAQWRSLAERAGWQVSTVYDLRNAWVKAIELIPVAGKEDPYVMGHNSAEMKRLAAQHEWIKASMGSLLHCPVNYKKESMRVLDSGTADGMFVLFFPVHVPPRKCGAAEIELQAIG